MLRGLRPAERTSSSTSRTSQSQSRKVSSLHSVLSSFSLVVPICFVIDNDIEITRVLSVRSNRDRSLNVVVRAQSDHVVQVEDGFCYDKTRRSARQRKEDSGREERTLPVSVLGVRTSRERNGLVARSESAVEPSEESVNVYDTKRLRSALGRNQRGREEKEAHNHFELR